MIKVLVDNGATITSGDVGQFACYAADQNNIDLLKEIIKFGGDVTSISSSGTTALHTAVSDDKLEVVKFLIEQGADIDKPDTHGWTSRALANHKCNPEIMALFQTMTHHKKSISLPPIQTAEPPYLVKHSSESSLPRLKQETQSYRSPQSKSRPRCSVNDAQNSLAGIITSGKFEKKKIYKFMYQITVFYLMRPNYLTHMSMLCRRSAAFCNSSSSCYATETW